MKIKIVYCCALLLNTCIKADWQERAKNILQFFSWDGQLLWSVRFARKEYINWLCTKVGEINATDGHGRTALIIATQSNRKKVVEMLIERSASIDKEDSDGNTALHYAHYEIAKILAEHASLSFKTVNKIALLPEETIYVRPSGKMYSIDSSSLPPHLQTNASQKKALLKAIKSQKGYMGRQDIEDWRKSCQLSSSNSSRMTSSLNRSLEDNSRNFE